MPFFFFPGLYFSLSTVLFLDDAIRWNLGEVLAEHWNLWNVAARRNDLMPAVRPNADVSPADYEFVGSGARCHHLLPRSTDVNFLNDDLTLI